MRSVKFACVVAAVLVASAGASAHASNLYGNVLAGKSEYDIVDGGTLAVSRFQTPAAVKIELGYRIVGGTSIEAGYTDLGRMHNVYSSRGIDGEMRAHTTSLSLSLKSEYPITGNCGVFLKGGVAKNRTVVDAMSMSSGMLESWTERKISPVAAVGVAYQATKSTSLIAQYETFGRLDGGGDQAKLFTVGFGLAF